MNSKMIASLMMAAISLLFACSTNSAKKKLADTNSTDIKAPEMVGTVYTTVVFNEGKASLTRENKDNIKALTSRAHKNKKPIDEIRILAWADNEYPDKMQEQAKSKDIKLASERAQKIKDYLEEDLKESEDIDAYNMARRPNLLSKVLRNDEYKVKEAFETSGATGSKLPDGSTSYTKASKALVIIDYEGNEDNPK